MRQARSGFFPRYLKMPSMEKSDNQQPDILYDGYKISQYFSHHCWQTSETGKAIEQHTNSLPNALQINTECFPGLDSDRYVAKKLSNNKKKGAECTIEYFLQGYSPAHFTQQAHFEHLSCGWL